MANKVLLLISLVTLPGIALAHGLATSKSTVVGAYQINLEYDEAGNPSAGEAPQFNFELVKPDTEDIVPFDRAFVTVTLPDGETVFAGNVASLTVDGVQSNRARIFLPKEGSYSFNMRFFTGGKELVQGAVTLPVDAAYQPAAAPSHSYAWLIAGALGGFFLGRLSRHG